MGRTWPSSSMRAWYRRSSCSACANFERSAPASCGERTRHLRAPPCCLPTSCRVLRAVPRWSTSECPCCLYAFTRPRASKTRERTVDAAGCAQRQKAVRSAEGNGEYEALETAGLKI